MKPTQSPISLLFAAAAAGTGCDCQDEGKKTCISITSPGRVCRHSFFSRALRKGFGAPWFAALCSLMIGAAHAADIQYYELFKGQMFTQSGTSSPIPAASAPYAFQVFVDPLDYPSYYLPLVIGPVIHTPAGGQHALTLNSQSIGGVFATNFVFMDSAATQSALDATYGAGTNTLSYVGVDDGSSSIVVSLPADDFPPAAPLVSNLVAAQSINSAADFTLQFGAWPAANTNDFVQLTVFDSTNNVVFSTPSLLALYPQSPLSATNNSIVISNGTLAAGQNYTATLAFFSVKTNRHSALPYVAAGFFIQTAFTLQAQSLTPPGGPPPASPSSLTNTLLTLTIASGTGPYAHSGTYQIFTGESGTNYTVLGNAGGGFGAGGYIYSQTGTTTGTIAFTDAKLGAVSLQIVFTSGGAGTFVLTSSSGAQAGVFNSGAAYPVAGAPDIFLPTVANSQFQAFVSGSPGVAYTVESSSNLLTWTTLTNVTIPNLTTNIVDPGAAPARYYRVKACSNVFAPGAITGLTLCCSINAGAAPFATNGIFEFAAGADGSSYQILAGTGATNGSGSYTYTVSGPNTAAISYQDSVSGAVCNEQLFFTSVDAGYFYTTNAAAAGFQSGSFTLETGPALFLGNVHFTPDTARGASVYFPADGTPVSLSVTDAAGYVWSLHFPADALLSPATLSMTPAAAVDTNQSVLPISSGVQLGPEGIVFCDGVTLTLTAPAALGAHATLMVGGGDGTGINLVQTTTQTNAYSTTLFHFSSGWMSDPDASSMQNLIDQAMADYSAALSEVRSLTKMSVQPPEPPDYELKCKVDTNAEARVNAYVTNLFLKENKAATKLLSAAKNLEFMTSDDSYTSYNAAAMAAVAQLIETSEFSRVNYLFGAYSGSPLKFEAVARAALSVAKQDLLINGPGIPGLFDRLASWESGNVLSYYWDQLINQHNYESGYGLLVVERDLDLLGAAPNSGTFLEQMATGFSFDVTLTNSVNMSGESVQAHGTITLNAYPQNPDMIGVTPDGGIQHSNTFSYDFGALDSCTLQLPLKFTEGAYFKLGCDISVVYMYILSAMGATQETWSCSGQPEQEGILATDFAAAYTTYVNPYNNGHGSGGSSAGDLEYIFPVLWRNKNPQPVYTIFPGGNGIGSMFTILVQHNTKSAPKKLSP